MARKPVARLGDKGSHGGVIITGANTFFVNNKPVARVGDIYSCPKHGPNPIVTGAPWVFGENQPVAHVDSKTACGAVIIEGSPDTFLDTPVSGSDSSISGVFGLSSSVFDECFQFFDAETKEPLQKIPYRIECDGVITYSGYTDDEGKTLRVYTNNARDICVYYGKELKTKEVKNG